MGAIKLIEQLIKGKYFHDFDVYLHAIKVLNNFENPYLNITELPYLYPPIISKLLEISNQSIFSFIYIIFYVTIIFYVYSISKKKIKISLLISLGVGGILIKSLMTGNIANIFYFLIIISIIHYNNKKNFLPYYITIFLMSIIKFNFIILFLLPIIINQNKKKEFLQLFIFMTILSLIYIYQYIFMNLQFVDFMNTLKSYIPFAPGSSIFAFLSYKLEMNTFISALIHVSIFALLLIILINKRDKIDKRVFVLSVLILLIFVNPRLTLYDVAFGIIFLNLAILCFDKKVVLNFFVFNLLAILFIKEITKYFDLNIGNPKMLAWYMFIYFFYNFFKKYKIINYNKIS